MHIFTPKQPKTLAVKAAHINVAQIREYSPPGKLCNVAKLQLKLIV